MRGQAAIEYLMNYGWAVLVIVAVLAVLISIFGMIGLPETCFVEGMSMFCEGKPLAYIDEQGLLHLRIALSNKEQNTINIEKMGCVVKQGAKRAPVYEDVRVSLTPGETRSFDLLCYGEDGQPFKAGEGQNIDGSVVIRYYYAGEPSDILRSAVVSFRAKAVQAS